ncbi:YdeI/OmpD-associated family protein [Rheinheimera pleomorphica]|uniref:YdeI/OmpD-associated family protein n=1 Tax=Rheinheimera pleomorphica TaxID=2703963 RepID=UPI00141DC097|nr:YdeI/OmpD-associated family protein [Rheinheimera pleomorphica]
MQRSDTYSAFAATVFAAAQTDDPQLRAFVVLPKAASDKLPRRGRTSVSGHINGVAFQATLEPDGQLSHWLALSENLLKAASAAIGDEASFDIQALHQEPEPAVPADLQQALAASADASAVWHDTTTIARLDWIHWITSAKQAKTRAKRVSDACNMLAAGKRRVCCFDPSGFYSKAFSAPKAAD